MIMVGGILELAATTSFLYIYVSDTDETYQRALVLGAESMEEPQDMPYGDRSELWLRTRGVIDGRLLHIVDSAGKQTNRFLLSNTSRFILWPEWALGGHCGGPNLS